MKKLSGAQEQEALKFFAIAGAVAQNALCLRDKCGSVVVSSAGDVIGEGYNGPPCDDLSRRRCHETYALDRKPKFDKSCCVHAEWRAILRALRQNPEKVDGSRLYFMRLDSEGKMTRAGEPYCTVCSRLAYESGIAEFALWRDEGVCVWETGEYDDASYGFYR